MVRFRSNKDGSIKHNGKKYTAIQELSERLDELNIPHTMKVLYDGYQIYVPDGCHRSKQEGDAIQHFGSYGAENNLIEVWGFGFEEPEGYLTVDEAVKYFVDWQSAREGASE